MPSRFPYRDADKAAEFALGYFQRLRADPDILGTWLGLRALIQVHVTGPDIAVHVDTRDGQTMAVTPGCTPDPPALALALSADTFHRIYAGELNVFLAFATRKIRTKGNVALIMKTTWTLPQAIRIYREYGAQLGLPGFEVKGTQGAPALQSAAEPLESHASTRVERLLQRRLRARREVCIERARYYTESMRSTEDEPQVIRQAKALAHVLGNLTVHMEPDELIVGAITGKVLGAGVYPEGIGARVLGELESIAFRETNPFAISDEQLHELRDQILPYWRGRTVEDIARGRLATSSTEPWSPAVTEAIDQVAPLASLPTGAPVAGDFLTLDVISFQAKGWWLGNRRLLGVLAPCR
jgi:hypothetical protein